MAKTRMSSSSSSKRPPKPTPPKTPSGPNRSPKRPKASAVVEELLMEVEELPRGEVVGVPNEREANFAWGKLLSRSKQIPHTILSVSPFLIGHDPVLCNLHLRDPLFSSVLCKLSCIEGGNMSVFLEMVGRKGLVMVNGRILRWRTRVNLREGDEVTFFTSNNMPFISSDIERHAYIFQQLSRDNLRSFHQAQRAQIEETTYATKLGDASEAARSSKVIYLPYISKDIRATSQGPNSMNVQHGLARCGPSSCETPDICSPDIDTNLNGGKPPGCESGVSVSSGDKTAAKLPSDFAGHLLFKDKLKLQMLRANDIEVSFDKFPYYLSESTKNILTSVAQIHLQHKEFIGYTTEITSLSQRILLCGPTWSELFQETLVKALAKEFNANLVIVDSLLQPCDACLRDPKPRKVWVRVEKSGMTENTCITLVEDLQDSSPSSDIENHKDLVALEEPTQVDKSDTFRQQHSSLIEAIQHPRPGSCAGSVIGTRVRYFGPLPECRSVHKSSCCTEPICGCRGKVMMTYVDGIHSKVGVRFDEKVPGGCDLWGLCERDHGLICFANSLELDSLGVANTGKILINELLEVVSDECKRGPLIVFMKDIEESIGCNEDSDLDVKNKLEMVPGGVLVIGSSTRKRTRKDKSHAGSADVAKLGSEHITLPGVPVPIIRIAAHPKRNKEIPKKVSQLPMVFPNKIVIQPPQDLTQLSEWNDQLDRDAKSIKTKSNITKIRDFLNRIGLEYDDLEGICIDDQLLTSQCIDKIVGFALSHHLQHRGNEGALIVEKLLLSGESIKHGISVLQNLQGCDKNLNRILKDVKTDNKFEKDLLNDVIPPDGIGVTFDDIGALETVKETLKELVMLPLQRPELFRKGQLAKPCKGILLFGPPGTGKTMLAKAVATEAGANFINISLSSISSKWLGEGEKYVKAIFSLASKISPSVIFVDEVDSILGKRENSREHDVMRRMKNEFMVNWDGLRTKGNERVLVLAATNRPFDLDEAVIRRLPRRLMVNLPDALNREKILHVILAKEGLAANVNLEVIANRTDGYSGSDLKNLCVAAAHCPIRDVLDNAKKVEKVSELSGEKTPPLLCTSDDIRPLNMKDFTYALNQASASVSLDSMPMSELLQWNEQYGEGGSGRKLQPSYFM